MPETNPTLCVVKSLPLSFYSGPLYARATRQWRGIGIGFILFVTLLAFAVSAIVLYKPSLETTQQLQRILTQMPDATMKDKKLSIAAPSPFIIKIFDTAENADAPRNFVIDTGFTSTDTKAMVDYMKKTDAAFLVTSDKLITPEPKNGVKVEDLSSVPEGHFTHDDWLSLSQKAGIWIYPVILIFTALWLVIANAIFALLGAVCASLLSLVAGVKLDFAAAMRLAATAAVPACVIATPLGLSPIVKIAIWLGYAIFGLLAVKKTETPPAPAAS